MALRSVIMWTLFSVIVVFVLSTGVQAQELRDVPASDILKQIENLLMSTGVQAQELTDDVPASKILEQIRKGEDVAYENVRITGDLNLSKKGIETVPNARPSVDLMLYGLEKELKIVESNITIRDSVFEEDVDFSNTEFRKDIAFVGTSFSGGNDFRGANFAGDAFFNNTNFTGDANFRGANFTGDAYFLYADFAGDADFRGAEFAGDAYFLYAKFARDTDFGNAKFAGYADFRYADFAGNANFWDANFTCYAMFSYTEFDKVSFTRTTFTTVSLEETDYNQMYVEWIILKDVLVFDGLTYIKLIKNLREREQFEDADAAYYQYRRLSQADKKWSFSKLMDIVAGVSCGYGVKPERPLIWGFLLIIIFALVYKQGNGIRRLKSKENGDNRVSFWDAFYFSVTTFTTVGYGDWYPIDRYRIVVMIEGVLGWLLLALFLVTLANVMIRP